MEARIENLEISHAHLQVAVDELTATVLRQQQTINELRNEIEYLKSLVKDLAPWPPPPWCPALKRRRRRITDNLSSSFL